MRVTAPTAVALAALSSLALSGCGTKTVKYQTAVRDCPTVSVLGHTGTAIKFPNDDPSSGPYTFRSDISGLRVKCDRNQTNVKIEMSFLEVASRNKGVTQNSVQFPFFMAVLYRGKMIDKKVFTSKFDFANGQERKGVVESFDTTLYFNDTSPSAKERERRQRRDRKNPLAVEGPKIDPQLADYQVLVGFQIDKKQLEFNVFH